jgi:hypothetical protein
MRNLGSAVLGVSVLWLFSPFPAPCHAQSAWADQGCRIGRFVSALVQLGESELRGSVYSDEEVKPSHYGTNLGDVDVEVSDRISLELALYPLAILHVGKPRDAMALKTAMKR